VVVCGDEEVFTMDPKNIDLIQLENGSKKLNLTNKNMCRKCGSNKIMDLTPSKK